MTNKKLKTATTSAAQNATSTGRTSANPQIASKPRQVLKMEVPEGVSMDELADKIAARMRGAELTSNAIRVQNAGGIGASLPASLVQRQEPTTKTTPIDGALTDLRSDLDELEVNLGYLFQAIDPILLYESDGDKAECGMALVAISPLHSRILDLSSLVRELNSRVVNTRERVQL